MGFSDWLADTIEQTGKAICDKVEDTGRIIVRRGDALFGCEEYEDAGVIDRLAGFAGGHDNGNYKKKIEKIAKGLEPGDIIGVSRGFYDHYGILINKDAVISYTSNKSDIGDNVIQATSFGRFLRGADEYFVLVFPDKYSLPDKSRFPIISSTFFKGRDLGWGKFIKSSKYKIYSPKETVKRAISRLGEDEYSLAFNNCEHFAIWCKTGIKESHQVNRILGMAQPMPLNIG